jgi:hypothetical protein
MNPGAGAYHLHVSGFGSALVAETALVRHHAFADVAGAAPVGQDRQTAKTGGDFAQEFEPFAGEIAGLDR